MAKKRILDLPETKGEFKVRGIVKGTGKDNFFNSTTTKNNKKMNIVKFGVQTDENSTVYLDINGMERDSVFFYQKPTEKGEKGVTKEVEWTKRNSFNEEGFEIIGTKLGLEKIIDEKGKERNDNRSYAEYDACAVLKEKLKEDTTIFARGKIEFSTFVNKNENIIRATKFIPSQISEGKPVDFTDEDFAPVSDFQQTIVFVEANKDDSDPSDVKGVIQAKIITYSTIEDAEFIVRNTKLFKNFKTKMKPYTAIKVWGDIHNKILIEEVKEDDGWGSQNSFNVLDNKKFERELVITGADPQTIDTETYSEKEIEKAVALINENKKAKSEYGTNTEETSWGSSIKNANEDEDGWD